MKRYEVEMIVLNNVKLVSWVRGKNGTGILTFQRRKRVKMPVKSGELGFYDKGHTIGWGDDSARFSPMTFMLIFRL